MGGLRASPPRARGWTLSPRREGGQLLVSPACAGMDPPWAPASPGDSCLPRVRGDGPLIFPPGWKSRSSPPRARGWTRSRTPGGRGLPVSPACAGMDPHRRRVRHARQGLPRVRGDGPEVAEARTAVVPSPPRARGWTLGEVDQRARQVVSPACAGMDPGGGSPCSTTAGLPRVRGDGPGSVAMRRTSHVSPPRARGWTRDAARSNHEFAVSPACAGMDPALTIAQADIQSLPRVRGDGPLGRVGHALHHTSPPRARGWTRGGDGGAGAAHVSPACAGMDPPPRRRARPRRSLPRVRGDGPKHSRNRALRTLSPPRARGWTRGQRLRAPLPIVSPACAGMDPAPRGEPGPGPGLPRVLAPA